MYVREGDIGETFLKGEELPGNLKLNRKKAGNEKAIWESGRHLSSVWSGWVARAVSSDKGQLLAKSI
jgi:hypothetical protein